MDRRGLLQSALAGLLGGGLGFVAPAFAQEGEAEDDFSFDSVIARARAAAAEPFKRPVMAMQGPFADLKYDQFRAIRFRDEKRLFADGGRSFQLELMPPGFYFQDKIEVSVVSGGVARPIAFSTDFFRFHPDYFPYPDGIAPADSAPDMGFSGIRFRHPLNRPGVWDELLVFQGASYFRAVARDTLYGLSARGLAIGTGGPEPEEFPLFVAFWVHEPQPGDTVLRLNALLDSESVTGAYEITVEPGAATVMGLRALLFPRRDIARIGIAPLTSMYFFGPENRRNVDDFRDAVHDSCGLRIINGHGERLWRPLRNPAKVEPSSFGDENPRGFGLIQRFRDFEHYQDAEAHYERRPSAWVEPRGDWGRGAVLLYELPSEDEFTDNIVAFWQPEAPLAAGSEHRFAYRLTWAELPEEELPLARVIATRSGRSILDANERVFVVDFDLGMIGFENVAPRVEASAGEAKGLSIARLPGGNTARVGFHFVAGDASASEFRLWLDSRGSTASEIWLYRWSA